MQMTHFLLYLGVLKLWVLCLVLITFDIEKRYVQCLYTRGVTRLPCIGSRACSALVLGCLASSLVSKESACHNITQQVGPSCISQQERAAMAAAMHLQRLVNAARRNEVTPFLGSARHLSHFYPLSWCRSLFAPRRGPCMKIHTLRCSNGRST